MVKDSGCEKDRDTRPMKRHLLPCSCSRRIEVAASQAGGTVICPGCGADLPVPRLRELSQLEVVSAAGPVPPGRRWGAAHAWLLAGALVAASAAATACWLHGRRAAVAPFDERAIRAAVDAVAVEQVYEWWRNYERQGIARPALAEEERRARHATSLATLERIAWGVAAVGAVLSTAAAFVVGRHRLRTTPTAAGSHP